MVTDPSVQTSEGSPRGGGVSESAAGCFGNGRPAVAGAHFGMEGGAPGARFAAVAGMASASATTNNALKSLACRTTERDNWIGMVLPGDTLVSQNILRTREQQRKKKSEQRGRGG